MLELKSDFTDEEMAKIIDIIRGFDYLSEVTFISFKYDNLVKLRKILPSQSAQFLFKEITDEIIERVITDRFDVDVKYTELTKENIEVFHAAGLTVNCWTVDSEEEAKRLVDMGVDYITSNILE